MARFAVKTPTHHTTWDRMLEVWQAADSIDLFESAWNFDHFYPIRGDTDGPCLEAWVTLSALAQATNRIRVGTMVNGMHFRHPAVLASMASSCPSRTTYGSTKKRNTASMPSSIVSLRALPRING